jgi:hypothetical protein
MERTIKPCPKGPTALGVLLSTGVMVRVGVPVCVDVLVDVRVWVDVEVSVGGISVAVGLRELVIEGQRKAKVNKTIPITRMITDPLKRVEKRIIGGLFIRTF